MSRSTTGPRFGKSSTETIPFLFPPIPLFPSSLPHRINLPKRRSRGGGEEEEGEGGPMKNSSSSEQLEGDGDTNSEVSSEVSFSYEFAQTEVMMKGMGSNGERDDVYGV